MSHILINCTCKNRLGSAYFDTTVYEEVQLIKNTLKQTKFEVKTVKSPSLRLFSLAFMTSWYFQTVRRMREAFRPSRQSSGEERFKYPLPWENKISPMPYPRANKDNQIPNPCPASPPPVLHWYVHNPYVRLIELVNNWLNTALFLRLSLITLTLHIACYVLRLVDTC